jgi:ABC-type multidrug transport system ATPase subunit
MQISLPVIFVGKQDSGKSTLLKLLFSNLKILSSNTKK